jgi:DNA polymerase I
MSNKKLAVIDGMSVFYRGYYAMPYLSNKDGFPTGGIYGFATMAFELVKKLKPDYVCVAWDKPKTSIRKRLQVYPEYKSGRTKPPDDFYMQLPKLKEFLSALDWPLLEFDDYEADDIMYTISKSAENQDLEIMLITSDMDMLQCVSDNCQVYALKKGFSNIERIDIKAVESKYGIKQSQFVDYKSLKGDSSDKIPGVAGIGPVAAAGLLSEYSDLKSIYDNIDLIAPSLRAKLEKGKDSAFMSYELAKMYDDAPIEMSEIRSEMQNLDRTKMYSLLTELEFKSLHSAALQLFGKTTNDISTTAVVEINDNISKVTTLYPLLESLQNNGNSTYIVLASYSAEDDFDLRLYLNTEMYIQSVSHKDLLNEIKRLVSLNNVFIATLSLSLITELIDIDDIAIKSRLIDIELYSYINGLDIKSSSPITYDHAVEILELAEKINSDRMLNKDSRSLLYDVEMPLAFLLNRMSKRGIAFDEQKNYQICKTLELAISDSEQEIYGYANKEFNISSPLQLSNILFNDLSLNVFGIKKNKSGYFSTASDTLLRLIDAHPIIRSIMVYRENTKLLNTYALPLPKYAVSGVIHTKFQQTVASTGRLSSHEPNLQNIPVLSDTGKLIRSCFISRSGMTFISLDYSQFELRVAAALSGQQDMIDAFADDSTDIHSQTASALFDVDIDLVTKQQRNSAKTVNFGVLYGQGPFALASQLNINIAEAKSFIDKYFETRKDLKIYLDNLRISATELGKVSTFFGRILDTSKIKTAHFIQREAILRQAINMPIQGTAADIMKIAMIEVDKILKQDQYMVMQIHDSMIIECKADDAVELSSKIKKIMENVVPEFPVMLRADSKIGNDWSKL